MGMHKSSIKAEMTNGISTDVARNTGHFLMFCMLLLLLERTSNIHNNHARDQTCSRCWRRKNSVKNKLKDRLFYALWPCFYIDHGLMWLKHRHKDWSLVSVIRFGRRWLRLFRKTRGKWQIYIIGIITTLVKRCVFLAGKFFLNGSSSSWTSSLVNCCRYR